MSVFTIVTPEQLSVWLRNYSIGALSDLQGIESGIENSNYRVTTSHGKFVLTLFEKLTERELPFHLNLMAHLASHGLPCPQPIANLQNGLSGELNGKPAAIATFLEGRPILEPTPEHCAQVGAVLAEMHLASRSYTGHQENLRGAEWWSACAREIRPFLDPGDEDLLSSEIRFQAAQDRSRLPRGVVHADLFCDNVLFEGDRVSGLIDFYFACVDCFVYDVAIAVNDWCTDALGALDGRRTGALVDAYSRVRPLSDLEVEAWPWMLRAGALRFWVSRLYDLHLPRPGELTHAHDPERFRRILRQHREATPSWPGRL